MSGEWIDAKKNYHDMMVEFLGQMERNMKLYAASIQIANGLVQPPNMDI